MSEVNRILSAIEQRDPHAAAQFLPLVYDELRKLAAAKLGQEKHGQTLQATALATSSRATRNMVKKMKQSVGALPPGEWRVVVLEVGHRP
jgi:hypothetical protein